VNAVTPPTTAWNGTPQPGQLLFEETFDAEALTSVPMSLADFSTAHSTGTSGYYAGDPWNAGAGNCNGWVLNQGTPWTGTGTAEATADDYACNQKGGGAATAGGAQEAWWFLNQMAYALGEFQGQPNPATNNAVSAETNGGTDQSIAGTDSTQFAVDKATPAIAGHYYLISIDLAATHCSADASPTQIWNDPIENLYPVVNGTQQTTAINDGSFSPCPTATVTPKSFVAPGAAPTSPRVKVYTSQISGVFLAPAGTTSIGMVLTNSQPKTGGNDMAYDDPKIIDVTPKLDKAITPSTIDQGGTAMLTFIITNAYSDPQSTTPSVLDAKPGLSFTDTLPVAGDNTVTVDSTAPADPGTCATTLANYALTATPGATSIKVSGDLPAGVKSCTVNVNVTSSTIGTWTNGPDAKSSAANGGGTDFGAADSNGGYADLAGLWAPSPVDLTVDGPALTLTKSTTTTVMPTIGGTIPYTFVVTNNGTAPLYNFIVTDTHLNGSPVSCTPIPWDGTLNPTDSTTCTALYTVTSDDVNAGGIFNTATAEGFADETCGWTSDMPSQPDPASCVPTLSNLASANVPGAPILTLVKSADKTTLVAGDTVTYSFLVSNVGSATADQVNVTDDTFTGTGTLSAITCPVTTLQVGDSTTCTATYVVTADDVAAGKVDNTATAHGLGPSMDVVNSKMVPDQLKVDSNSSSVEIVAIIGGTGGSVISAMVLWPMLALIVTGLAIATINWRRKLAV